MKITIPPQKIFYYNENGHVVEFKGVIETNLFAPKGFPAYQMCGDRFYVVNHSNGESTMIDGEPDDILVFLNHGYIDVVKKKDFQMSDYGYANTIREPLWKNTADFLDLKNRSTYRKEDTDSTTQDASTLLNYEPDKGNRR